MLVQYDAKNLSHRYVNFLWHHDANNAKVVPMQQVAIRTATRQRGSR